MPVEHIPLLRIQRELHDIPRGMERFQAYLKTITNDEGDDVRYMPLVAMNPMGREHVAERLDELLALDGDVVAETAAAEAIAQLGDIDAEFKHGLVILDDVRGGWTNRTVNDAWFRFGLEIPAKRPWLTTAWWVSETPSVERIRQAVKLTVFRLIYVYQHGKAQTLREMMQQEGQAGIFAGVEQRHDREELEYSRHVITPYLDSTNYAVHIAALYGDNAARSLGYEPLGLSEDAGFMLALDGIE